MSHLLPIILLSLFALTNAKLVEVFWNISYSNANPDGLFERRVIGINGSWPPPPIHITMNDTLRVHAFNSLSVPSALHHHGMFFNGTSYYDGAVGVTQCGIPTGHEYIYDVDVKEWDQWGTYWVHAHSSGQYVDGLRAPFIIHRNPDFVTSHSENNFTSLPPNTIGEAYAYDAEYTVLLSDWYHDEHEPLVKHFISIANPGGAEPVPDSALIYFEQNGSYLPPISSTTSGASANYVNKDGSNGVGFNNNATIKFEPGKTYRLRIINMSAFSMFFFWIEGHDMSIIEVDGTDVEETPISDPLSITVAQRYSVLVRSRNDTGSNVRNWVIHANMDTDMFDTVPDNLQPNVTSTITYDTSASMADNTDKEIVDEYITVEDEILVPLIKFNPPPPTRQLSLEVSFDTLTDGTNRAMFNNVTYNAPIVPSFFSELSLGNWANLDNVYGPSSFVINKGDVIEMEVINLDAGKHPFHLHGHKFSIIARTEDITSPDNTTTLAADSSNPMKRDTIEIPSGGSVKIRWIADNPGAWLFHCHIDWHLSAGLAVVFLSAPLEVQSLPAPPSFAFDMCSVQGIPTTGNAAGHNSTTDLSGLTVGPYLQNNGWHARGIGAMAGSVLSAVLGIIAIAWYSYGHQLSDEEVEEETKRKVAEKEMKGGKIGVWRSRVGIGKN